MLRTLPLASDTKTVAVVRTVPVKQSRSKVSPSCTPLTASSDTVPDATSPYRTGAIIAGKYRLMRQLGRGGMGEVWSAEHLALSTQVAVKFLSTGAGGAARRLALERFRFEAQVSAHLGLKTAHVVAVHDAGSDASGPYLVMEHVRGRTLRMELNRRGQIAPHVLAHIIDQVAEALSIAHAFGIIHRDLKPSNLLLVERRGAPVHVKVADFGIAKALGEELGVHRPEDTSDGFLLGSPAYMSPEQMAAGAVDPRTDMWSLGVIAYEALTGRLPFPGRSVSEIIMNMSVGRFDLPSKIVPSLSRDLDDWFLCALSKKKEHRFRTMAEMAVEFRRAALRRPARRAGRVARTLAVVTSLTTAILALRPSPSEALPEEVPTHLPAALVVPASAPTPLPSAGASAANRAGTAGAPTPEPVNLPAGGSASRSSRAAPPPPPAAAPARRKVLTEVF